MLITTKIRKTISKAFCFIDNTTARDEWVISQLNKLPKDSKLLDAGAGECKYKPNCSNLLYTSQDFNQYDGKGDNTGLHTKSWDGSQIDIVGDILNIPVESNSFDAILCTEVFEHIPYPDRAITEFSRILKTGGKLILTAPFCSQTHFAPYHFCSGFNSYWYKKIFADNNLEIVEYKKLGNYFDFVLQELLRVPLALAKYSALGYLAYALYFFILPVAVLIYLLSLLTKNSEQQLFFSSFVLAQKK